MARGGTGHSTFDRVPDVDVLRKWLRNLGPFLNVATTQRSLILNC